MSKQLKLDSFWKEKNVTSTSTTEVIKKRKLEETKSSTKETGNMKSTYKQGKYSYPFWWTKEKEDMLQVKSIPPSSSSSVDKNICWTKKLVEQSSLTEGVLFSSKDVPKENKQVSHKTGLSKKQLDTDEIIRSRKILLKPTSEQKKKIQEWMRITRFVYNLTHHFVEDLGYDANFMLLKNSILNANENPESSKYPWLFNRKLKKIPRDALDYAIQQYVCNVHSSTEMLKEKQKKTNKKIKLEANMKKRNEKMSQSVGIPVNGGKPSIKWNEEGFFFWPSYKLGALKTAQKDSVQVHEVSEHYTSCTCGSCGKIDWKLGKKDHFNCKYCNFSLPRDYNGARNIFLMNIQNFIGNPKTASTAGDGPIPKETLILMSGLINQNEQKVCFKIAGEGRLYTE